MLHRVYQHIEQEALKALKSKELRAIRAWAYENILINAVAKESVAIDKTLLDELVSSIGYWQKEYSDPVLNFSRKLQPGSKKQGGACA